MQRVVVVGNSGSGKSTLAVRIAERIGAPHVELDSIRHLAGWVELPDREFIAEVEARTRSERWVVDGNYAVVRDVVWPRADTVVWPCLKPRAWGPGASPPVLLALKPEAWPEA